MHPDAFRSAAADVVGLYGAADRVEGQDGEQIDREPARKVVARELSAIRNLPSVQAGLNQCSRA